MPKKTKTIIRIDNSNNITYVLNKFNNGTFKMSAYNRNMATGCYSRSNMIRGVCNPAVTTNFWA